MRHYLAVARALALLPVAAASAGCGARTNLRTPATTDASDVISSDIATVADTGFDSANVDVPQPGRCVNAREPDAGLRCDAGTLCYEIGGAISSVFCGNDVDGSLSIPCGWIACERACACVDAAAPYCLCHPGLATLPPPDLGAIPDLLVLASRPPSAPHAAIVTS